VLPNTAVALTTATVATATVAAPAGPAALAVAAILHIHRYTRWLVLGRAEHTYSKCCIRR
jgi:hypothetical protein